MDIFGIGSTELLVVALLAAVVLGPERLLRVARAAGRMVREVKAYFGALSDELQSELDLLDELKDVQQEIKKLER
jgi:sec-independent protein translocase protein TatB